MSEPNQVFDLKDVADAQARLRIARTEAWESVVPARFVDAVLDDFADEPDSVRDRLIDWSEDPKGRNLILGGPVGVGKTHAAIAACWAIWDSGVDVVFYPVGEMLDDLKPGGEDFLMFHLCEVPVLIMDDIGSERTTDWTQEQLYNLINRRWLEARPIVATSNLDKVALSEKLGERAYSRLVGGAVGVRLTGGDKRRQQ